MDKNRVYNCPFEVTIEIIGGKWKSIILWYLYENRVLRNGELIRLIPSITQKMLTQQLREMEDAGLIVRKVYEQVPPKVEYALTPLAEELQPIFELMKDWGLKYIDEHSINLSCQSKK